MGKVIKITDEVYEKLQSAAVKDKRSMSEEIDYLLTHRVELSALVDVIQGGVTKKEEPKPAGLVQVRTPTVIDAEIARLKKERDEELEFVQDYDIVAGINDMYENILLELEAEKTAYYNGLNK